MAIYDVPPVADSGDEEFLYQVLYDYTATDTTELTIKEGDMVISVAGFTAGMFPGWLMVRQEGELDEGWVPESYLKKLGLAYSPEPSTGTVKSPENQKPMCKHLSHTHTHTPLMRSCPLVRKDQDPLGSTQRLTSQRIWHFFRGAGLGTRRKTSTAPLVWCWHPKSNLDPTRLLALPMGLMFLPFCPPQPKPGPYFTARYAGTMGIK